MLLLQTDKQATRKYCNKASNQGTKKTAKNATPIAGL